MSGIYIVTQNPSLFQTVSSSVNKLFSPVVEVSKPNKKRIIPNGGVNIQLLDGLDQLSDKYGAVVFVDAELVCSNTEKPGFVIPPGVYLTLLAQNEDQAELAQKVLGDALAQQHKVCFDLNESTVQKELKEMTMMRDLAAGGFL